MTLSKYVQVPNNIEYEDIYRSVDKQLKIVKVFKQLLRAREILTCEEIQCDRLEMEKTSSKDGPCCTSQIDCVAVKKSC